LGRAGGGEIDHGSGFDEVIIDDNFGFAGGEGGTAGGGVGGEGGGRSGQGSKAGFGNNGGSRVGSDIESVGGN